MNAGFFTIIGIILGIISLFADKQEPFKYLAIFGGGGIAAVLTWQGLTGNVFEVPSQIKKVRNFNKYQRKLEEDMALACALSRWTDAEHLYNKMLNMGMKPNIPRIDNLELEYKLDYRMPDWTAISYNLPQYIVNNP